MKVLQINAVFGYKSTGVIVKDIGDTLSANGHTPYYAYQTANGQVNNGYRIGNKLDWKFHALFSRIFGKQAYASKCATRRFLKWVDKIKPDVVHLHNVHSNYINLNLLCDYLAKKDIATVITLHDCWYFTGKCSHYVLVGCDKWQTACGNCPQNKKEVPSLFFDSTAKVLKDKSEHLNKIKNLTLVGCSNWIAEEVKKSKLTPKNIEVVYNGVDTDIFTPHENDFRKNHNIGDEFVIMGMADKWGQDRNRQTAKKIIEENKDAKIVIVGCKDHHKEFFSKYDNVITIGYVSDRRELSDIYASSDVFVNLTHADTLPTVNMESICSGTPVITFNCTGSPELVDEDSGIVVDEDDTDAMIYAIEKIKTVGLKFSAIEKQQKFDKNKNYKKYLEIYKKAIQKD